MKRTDRDAPATDAATDGGVETSPFDTVSDVERTRNEKFRRFLDEQVAAPLRIIWNDWRGRIGFLLTLPYVAMGLIAVFSQSSLAEPVASVSVAGYRPFAPFVIDPPLLNAGPILLQPFEQLAFPLGTTRSGVDLLSQTIYATLPMLQMITSGAVFSIVVASVVGMVSGYKGGMTDEVLMTFTDIALNIPGLPLTVVVVTVIETQSAVVLGIVLTINAWAGLARAIRSQVLTIREESYVEASRTMGMPTRYVVREDILPNLMPYITINFMNAARGVIYGSVGLYFIGILPRTGENWGLMLKVAYNEGALTNPERLHWLVIPLVVIMGLSFALILLAQSLDRVFNPRVRARHAKTIESDGSAAEDTEAAATKSGGFQ